MTTDRLFILRSPPPPSTPSSSLYVLLSREQHTGVPIRPTTVAVDTPSRAIVSTDIEDTDLVISGCPVGRGNGVYAYNGSVVRDILAHGYEFRTVRVCRR